MSVTLDVSQLAKLPLRFVLPLNMYVIDVTFLRSGVSVALTVKFVALWNARFIVVNATLPQRSTDINSLMAALPLKLSPPTGPTMLTV